jgi:hypothetical protein
MVPIVRSVVLAVAVAHYFADVGLQRALAGVLVRALDLLVGLHDVVGTFRGDQQARGIAGQRTDRLHHQAVENAGGPRSLERVAI